MSIAGTDNASGQRMAELAVRNEQAKLPSVDAERAFSLSSERALLPNPQVSVAADKATIRSQLGVLSIAGPDGESVAERPTAGLARAKVDEHLFVGTKERPRGVQMLSEIRGPDAPKSIRYQFDLPKGTSLVKAQDGSVEIVAATPNPTVSLTVGKIAAPWAVDAHDAPVDTQYTVEGNVLTQHIDHAGASYPVIADPYVTLGTYIYVTFYKSEVQYHANNWNGTHTIAAAVCGAVTAWNPAAGGVCFGAVVANFVGYYSTWDAARDQNECLRYALIYSIYVPRGVAIHNC